MESAAEDKQWATKYLLDPLNAPEPYEETGLSSIKRAPSIAKTGPTVTSSRASSNGYPTPPASASPTQSTFHPTNPYSSHRSLAFGEASSSNSKGRRRGSSLSERYPGDMSHRPLDQLRREAKAADRSPHLKKKHMPGADTIDVLDRTVFGGAYHHEGPYDATLLARNTNYQNSPVAAVKDSNAEALRATPRERIKDSLDRHVPLQDTATIPPGMAGIDGKEMQYEEGDDLMRDEDAPGGPYKRWPGIKYLPEDYKGKGEPSFTLERALKEQNQSGHRRIMSDGNSYEMQTPQRKPVPTRQRSVSGSHADFLTVPKATGSDMSYSEYQGDMRRSNTTGRRVGDGIRGDLKRRFGSLRRSKKKVVAEA